MDDEQAAEASPIRFEMDDIEISDDWLGPGITTDGLAAHDLISGGSADHDDDQR